LCFAKHIIPSQGHFRHLRPLQSTHRHESTRLVHDYAFDDATRRAATRETYSPVMILLTTIATIGILFYG